jgi:hypothetical protein
MYRSAPLSFLLLSALLCGCVEPPPEPVEPPPPSADPVSVFLLEVSETEGSWHDAAFLAAVPTSAWVGGGVPTVVVAPDLDDLPRATQDLLSRLRPGDVFALNSGAEVSGSPAEALEADDASGFSLALIDRFWTASDAVVIASETDYSAGLLASSLASLLKAPLLFADTLDPEVVANTIQGLGASTVLQVSLDGTPLEVPEASLLAGTEAVLDWLGSHGHTLDYLALANPTDREAGRAPKASLFAPVYATRRRGLVLPLALSMPTPVVTSGEPHPAVDFLADVYERIGYHPSYLAIVGAHDALPQSRRPSIFDNPVEEHPVSDLPYGETDEDSFLDISIGRIAADTAWESGNLAARSVAYDLLQDGHWEHRAVEAGLWGFDELRDLFLNVGFDTPEHLSLAEISERSSLEVGAFLHKDHSGCWVLGNGFELDTATLLAPAVVVSRGCSVAGIDQLATSERSIVDHLLGSGAVAFVGASRNSIAQNTIIEVSMWNAVLSGSSLGDAFRSAINEAMVHWRDEGDSAGIRYSIDIEMLYGDPALTTFVPRPPLTDPARAVRVEDTVTVTPPEEWNVVQYHPEQLAEWNYGGDLFMYTGAGASPQTYWAGSYDREDMYYGVRVLLEDAPTSLEELGVHEEPLGWSGGLHLDSHQDGTVSAMWRVRLIDFDPLSGELTASAPEFTYRLN